MGLLIKFKGWDVACPPADVMLWLLEVSGVEYEVVVVLVIHESFWAVHIKSY